MLILGVTNYLACKGTAFFANMQEKAHFFVIMLI